MHGRIIIEEAEMLDVSRVVTRDLLAEVKWDDFLTHLRGSCSAVQHRGTVCPFDGLFFTIIDIFMLRS